MIAFTIYAALVTFFAARWRRTLRGFVIVALADALLVGLAWLHLQIPVLEEQGFRLAANINIRPFQAILYPYIAVIALVGLFVASLPRHAPVESCGHCRYDLSALLEEPGPLICPECGRRHVRIGSKEHRQSGTLRSNYRESDFVAIDMLHPEERA
ncbi:MAG: hypothetical protein KF757_08315 [Phycisphaeraceae bacterium]|nr:hypothetical protein [Phycisphaeraceae bacterium]MCW5762760.1 hypothetical protein [Phycisphaeraceae bacterium]